MCSFSDVVYFQRVISDSTGTAKDSIFSERTEESSAVQYFQVWIVEKEIMERFTLVPIGTTCLGNVAKA